jgi:hypothetical protein
MVVCSKVARFPGLRKPTTAVPPKYKALLIGINYTSLTGDNEQGRRPLTGPVNDAKGMKKVLIGEVSARLTLEVTHELNAITYRGLPLQGKGYFIDDRRGIQQGHGTLALPGKYC